MRKLLQKHNFRYKKKWGQNFIFERNLLHRLVKTAGIKAGDCVLEIGAGAGTLTQELLAQGATVLAVEIDPFLVNFLLTHFSSEKVTFVSGDILKMDLSALIRQEGWSAYQVVANLPYQITSPLVLKLLEEEKQPLDMVLMMQKEVAERLTARPGTKAYGIITLLVQYYATAEILFPVSRHVFQPVPRVDSVVVRLQPRPKPYVEVGDKKLLFKIIKAAFGQRRKVLLNSLLQVQAGLTKVELKDLLLEAGLDPGVRGEVLNLEEFALLANFWLAKFEKMV